MENNIKTDKIYISIKEIIEHARKKVYTHINHQMIQAYWNIGKIIVENEQKGEHTAKYGLSLLERLSAKLTQDYGKGYTISNIKYMRQFYLTFPIRHAVRGELSWTHYRSLLAIEETDKRDFYINQTIKNHWSTRELDKQTDSLLYERMILSRKTSKAQIEDQLAQKPEDVIKDPYVLDFLNIKGTEILNESDLEKALIKNIEKFLRELGKGFSFVDSQMRLPIGDKNYYVDLVFYNFILKCFVLIDLKVGALTPQDIGQMDFYVNYFQKEIKQQNDNQTIGIILCAKKDEVMAKYTQLDKSDRLFASKYKLYLPSISELKEEVSREVNLYEQAISLSDDKQKSD